MSNLVSLNYLDDYSIEELREVIEEAFSRLNIQSIKPKMKVLIKVCLPESISKDAAETTNPAVVRAVVDYVTKLGARCIVADSPFGKYKVDYLDNVYLNTGMLEMANLTNCDLNRDLSTAEVEIPNGVMTKNITILDVANQADVIINVGKLKMDDNLGYLGACSNIFGIIPGDMKNLLLSRFETLGDFNNFVIDMMEEMSNKVVLNIVDAIVALEANKTQRMLNCLAISSNAYALDAVISDILGVKYEHTLLKLVKDRDLIDFNHPYKIVGEDKEKFKLEDFALVEFDNNKKIGCSNSYFKKHQQRPNINKKVCKGCKICSKICPTNAILMKYDGRGELYAEIDYKKCILCNKCITACPYSVVNQITPSSYKKIKKQIHKFDKDKK